MFDHTICLGRGLPFEPVEWSADLSGMGAFEPSRHSQQEANGCVKQFFPANHRGLQEKIGLHIPSSAPQFQDWTVAGRGRRYPHRAALI